MEVIIWGWGGEKYLTLICTFAAVKCKILVTFDNTDC